MNLLLRSSVAIGLAVLAAPLGAETKMRLSETLDHKTASIVYPIDCDEKAESVRVQLLVRVEDGEIAWTLVDPSGRTRLTGAGTAGRVSGDSGALEPVIGRWKLHVGLDRFTGNYQVNGTAR